MVRQILSLKQRGAQGVEVLPTAVEVSVEVGKGSVGVVQDFLDDPAFDREVEAELLNRLVKIERERLPVRIYNRVQGAARTRVAVREVMKGQLVRPVEPAAPPEVGDFQVPTKRPIYLAWSGQQVTIQAGQRVMVGRYHDGSPKDFVGLEGASNRISKHHLTVANGARGVTIHRPAGANPLAVNGRSIERGGECFVEQLPVELKLSNGEVVLRLLPQAGS